MVLAIDEVKSAHHVILNPDVTYSYPVNSCASGKLLLSHYSDEQLRGYLSEIPMRERTSRTILEREEFIRAVRSAQGKGYSTEILEFSDDLNSVAAPIIDVEGTVIATISISGPSMRLTEARIMDLVQPLMQAARRITERVAENTRSSFRPSR